MTAVPVLLYHSVSADPSPWIAPFTVTAERLDKQLALIAAAGRTPVTVSQLREGLSGAGPLPTRPVVVTFDDGFADTLTAAAPVLQRHGLTSTIYLTTGFIGGVSPGGDRMLDWTQARELADRGHEIGAHSVTHPQLDLLPRAQARQEIQSSRELLQERLDVPVRSFAYPHGYSSPAVRRQVMEAGYESACSVKNVVSGPHDTPFSISRLTVTAGVSDDTMRQWLNWSPPTRRRDERLLTKGWRAYRRLRHVATALGDRS
jgi:peptidoglycan/xylan/chitin deacetylase (PgdA/CDA1 family)